MLFMGIASCEKHIHSSQLPVVGARIDSRIFQTCESKFRSLTVRHCFEIHLSGDRSRVDSKLGQKQLVLLHLNMKISC